MTLTLECRGTAEGVGQRGGDIRLVAPRRWFRVGAYYDPGPRMSHIGFWHTRWGGLRGVNLRFKWPGGYVTCLAHTRAT
jgi:hypothetical protein